MSPYLRIVAPLLSGQVGSVDMKPKHGGEALALLGAKWHIHTKDRQTDRQTDSVKRLMYFLDIFLGD